MCLINGKNNKAMKRLPLILLIVLIAFSIFVFTYLCWQRHKALFNYEYIDLAEIINISWNTAQGRIFYQTINPNPYGVFLLHIQPAILFISLFFIIFNHPISVYIGFNFALAIAALPLYLLAKNILKSDAIAAGIAAAYLFYAPLKSMYLLSDPDPILLVIPFIFLFFYFLVQKSFKMYVVSILFILACGESMGLLVSTIGIYLLCLRYNRKLGIILMLGGISYTFLAARLIEISGIYNHQSLYCFLKYNSFAENLNFIVFHPFKLFFHIIQHKHFLFLAKLLKPVFFLPLLLPEFYISLPVFFQIFLCKRAIEFGRAYYAAPLVPLMFVAIVFFFNRLRDFLIFISDTTKQRIIGITTGLLLISCLYSNFIPNILGYLREDRLTDERFRDVENIYDKRFYQIDKKNKAAWELINLIPPEAGVMATADLCAALATRKIIYCFPYPYAENNMLRNEKVDLEKMQLFLEKLDYLFLNYEYKGYGVGEYPSFSVGEFERVVNYLIAGGKWKTLVRKNRLILLVKR